MKLISVNVGLPRDIIWRGKAVKSSIWRTLSQAAFALMRSSNKVSGPTTVSFTSSIRGREPDSCRTVFKFSPGTGGIFD